VQNSIEIFLPAEMLASNRNTIVSSDAEIITNGDSEDDDDGAEAKLDSVATDVSQTGRTSNDGVTVNSNQDSPESLVRNENKAFQILRALLVISFVVGAVGSAAFVYIFIRNSEEETFTSEYEAITSLIVGVLSSDIARVFYSGRSAAIVTSLAMTAYNVTASDLVIPNSEWAALSSTFIAGTTSPYMSWSPLLRNDVERKEFETFVDILDNEGVFSGGEFPACYMCGSSNQGVTNPLHEVELGAYGTYSCGYIERFGRSGGISEGQCTVLIQGVSSGLLDCRCGPVDYNANDESRSPAQGIFRYEASDDDSDKSRIVNSTWNGGPYLPLLQDSALQANKMPLLYDHLSDTKLSEGAMKMLVSKRPTVTQSFGMNDFANYFSINADPATDGPMAVVFNPVAPNGNDVVGSISLLVTWSKMLTNTVPKNGRSVDVVLENTCGQLYTYRVAPQGSSLIYVGDGDQHDKKYDNMMRDTGFVNFRGLIDAWATSSSPEDEETDVEHCLYRFNVYPTNDLRNQYVSSNPIIYAAAVLCIFLYTSLIFLLYDYVVRRRQAKVMASAIRTNDIVTSLFPTNVRDRLYEANTAAPALVNQNTSKKQMQSFLLSSNQASVFGSEPIADLFSSASVIFIDIANFTAWCSERDPSQVFILLENLYHAFDVIGEQLGIFKVETIGDSYVAVVGLPVPMQNHAVAMARFASLCLRCSDRMFKELEVTLGPSTGDLSVRIGLHSGPVTAGVLRGAKARFQLFGDTVNTAARLEASGEPSRIHASHAFVQLLQKSNRDHWATERSEKVTIKGKGELQTYWVHPRKNPETGLTRTISSASVRSQQHKVHSEAEASMLPGVIDFPQAKEQKMSTEKSNRNQRLVEWNVEMLYGLLEKLVSSRTMTTARVELSQVEHNVNSSISVSQIVIDEITQILRLPAFDEQQLQQSRCAMANQIKLCVKEQLREFVWNVANLYGNIVESN
jgi:class 3 adenylate cyclase